MAVMNLATKLSSVALPYSDSLLLRNHWSYGPVESYILCSSNHYYFSRVRCRFQKTLLMWKLKLLLDLKKILLSSDLFFLHFGCFKCFISRQPREYLSIKVSIVLFMPCHSQGKREPSFFKYNTNTIWQPACQRHWILIPGAFVRCCRDGSAISNLWVISHNSNSSFWWGCAADVISWLNRSTIIISSFSLNGIKPALWKKDIAWSSYRQSKSYSFSLWYVHAEEICYHFSQNPIMRQCRDRVVLRNEA